MNTNHTAKLGLTEVVKRLRKLERAREELERYEIRLRKSARASLAHGERTDSPMVDFVLSTTGGTLKNKLVQQYELLQEVVRRQPSPIILAVQFVNYHFGDIEEILQTLYLARTRDSSMLYDVERRVLGIPVETNYYKHWDVFEPKDGTAYSMHGVFPTNDLLCLGPLYSHGCKPPTLTINEGDEPISCPENACFSFDVQPFDETEIDSTHGVCKEKVHEHIRAWMRLNATPRFGAHSFHK